MRKSFKQVGKRFNRTLLMASAVAAAALSIPNIVQAATIYWDLNSTTTGSGGPTPTGIWDTSTTANWDATANGTGSSTTWSSTANVAQFSAGTDATGSYNVTVTGTVGAAGIIFDRGTVTLLGSSTPVLQLGTSGIVVNSTVGGTTTLDSSLNNVQLTGAQSWSNNSTSLLAVNSGVTTDGTSRLLTLNGSGTGGTSFAGVLADNGSGKLSVTINTTGGTTTLANSNTFSGATTLTAGTLKLTNTGALTNSALSLNGGILQLRSDTNNATFATASTTIGTTTINVDQASSGSGLTLKLGAVSIGANTLTVTNGNTYNLSLGAVTDSDNTTFTNNMTSGTLTLASLAETNAAGKTATFNGTSATAITSVGNITQGAGALTLTQSGSGTLLLTGTNSYSGTTNVSAGILKLGTGSNISTNTLAVSGTGSFDLNGNNVLIQPGGNNITINSSSSADGITNSSSTVATLTVTNNGIQSSGNYSGKLNLVFNNNANTLSTMSGAFNNIGDITFNATNISGFSISSTFSSSNTGTITNLGASGMTTTISSAINGSTVKVTQNGNSTLVLTGASGASTYQGNTTVLAGTLQTDYTASTVTTNMINSGSALVLGGGTYSLKGKASNVVSQTFASLTLNADSYSGITTNNTGTSTTLNFTNTTWTRSNAPTAPCSSIFPPAERSTPRPLRRATLPASTRGSQSKTPPPPVLALQPAPERPSHATPVQLRLLMLQLPPARTTPSAVPRR